MGVTAGFGTRFLYTLEPVMGALLPLEGKVQAVANPAENAVLGSSLETFLMTSILDTICFPLGGFSGVEQQREKSQHQTLVLYLGGCDRVLTPNSSVGSHSSHLCPWLSSCFRVERRLKINNMQERDIFSFGS